MTITESQRRTLDLLAESAKPSMPVIVFESESYRVIHVAGLIEIQDLDCDDAVAIEVVHAVGIAMQILAVFGDMPVEVES